MPVEFHTFYLLLLMSDNIAFEEYYRKYPRINGRRSGQSMENRTLVLSFIMI